MVQSPLIRDIDIILNSRWLPETRHKPEVLVNLPIFDIDIAYQHDSNDYSRGSYQVTYQVRPHLGRSSILG